MPQGTLKFWHCRGLAMSCIALAFISMTLAPVLMGQSATTGALSGTVKDASGAVIPNATVTVTSIGSGQARTTTTSANGAYSVGFLAPGNYQVKFEAAGFGTATVPSITINVTETPTLDQVLSIGTQSQQVEVHGEAAELVQTATSSVGTVVSSDTATTLPLTTRNYTNLVGLSAGVQVPVFNAVTMGRGSQDIYVNGAGYAQNNYQQDGASVNSYAGTGSVADQGSNPGIGIVNPDAIAEFKIQTSLFDAAYGREPGANVNVVTKSGTNQYHGTVFEFFRNTVFDANDYFVKMNVAPVPNSRPVLNQNQFGGSFGGPIKKDKLFFFASEQETRQINGAAAYGFSAPTLPGIPQGDRSNTAAFAAALGASFCPTGPNGAKTNAGGVQVACNGSNINPVALNILQLKLPNGSYFVPSSSTGLSQSVTYSLPVHFTEHQIIGNVDYVVNQKNTLSLRYFYSRDPAAITMSCAGSGGSATSTGTITPCLPGAPGTTLFPASYTTLRLTTLLTNNLVNEARMSVQTVKMQPTQGIPFTDTQVGMTPIIPAENTFGQIVIKNPNFEFGGGSNLAKYNFDSAWEAADQVSWSHGKHTVRGGFEYERDRINEHSPGSSLTGITFQTFQDFLMGLPGCSPALTAAQCTASGLTGATNGSFNSNIISTGTGTTYAGPTGLTHFYRANIMDGFVADDFKVTRNLTLNLGVRWEYDGWATDTLGKNTNPWPSLIATVNVPVTQGGTLGTSAATGTLAGWVIPANYIPSLWPAPPVAGVTQSKSNNVAQSGAPKDNFAPRIGFAWKPTSSDRLVVRGGFGMFYDRLSYSFFNRTSAPPYAVVVGQGSASANYYSDLSVPYLSNPSLGWANAVRWANINTATNSGTTSNINTNPVGPILPIPTTYQYPLAIQYEIAPSWMLEVGYVGSHGVHLYPQSGYTERELNQAILASASNPVNGITTNTVANANVRVPYLGFAPGGLFADETSQWARYNSLQVTVRKQLSHGLQLQAAYSWSKALSSATYVNYNDANTTPYGPNFNYRPQRLAVNYHWDLPFGQHDGLVGKAVNGWSVAGVTIVQDGQPQTPVDGRGGTIYGFGGNGASEVSTPEFASGMTAANVGNPGSDQARLGCANTTTCTGWFNRAAYGTVPVIGATTGVAGTGGPGYGNSGYGIVLGPGQFNWDMTIQKITKVGGLHEDATLVFRTDFFNTFNHPQFGNPASVDLSTANFGQITNTSVNPRLMQFSLKYVF